MTSLSKKTRRRLQMRVPFLRSPKSSSNTPKTPWAYALDLVFKSGLGYVVGFCLINASYFFIWGFTDFSLSHVQCILGAGLFFLIFGAVYTPALGLSYLFDKINPIIDKHKNTRNAVLICVVSLFLFSSIPTPFRHTVGSLIGSSSMFRAIGAILSNAAGKSSLLTTIRVLFIYLTCIVMAMLPATYSRDLPSLSAVKWNTLRYMIPPVVVVSLLIAMIFIFIPAPLGGLNPRQETIWVSSGALDILAPCNKGAMIKLQTMKDQNNGKRSDLFQVDNLYLLHEGSTHTFLWSDECTSISKVSNELIKGTQWTDPNRKAIPAPTRSQQTVASEKKAAS